MRRLPLLLIVLLAGCGDESMTRTFNLSRDSAPENMAATQMPLSMPPSMAIRPERPGALTPNRDDAQTTGQAAGSEGQDALVEAAGPSSSSDIRTVINENAGLVYPGPAFVDQLMSWTPPAGYTPVIVPPPKGGWISRMF